MIIMNHTTKRETSTLAVMGFILIVIGGAYVFFFLSVKERATRADEIAAQANDLEDKNSSFSRADTFFKDHANDIERVNDRFVKESEIVSFAERIEELSVSTGTYVTLESLEPESRPSGAVLAMRVRARGSFSGVMKFTELIQKFPALIEVRTLNIVRRDERLSDGEDIPPSLDGGKNPLWEISISAVVINFTRG